MEDSLTRRDVKKLLHKLVDNQEYRGSNLSQFDIYLLLIMTAEKLMQVANAGSPGSLTGKQLQEVIKKWDELPLVSVSKRFKHCKNVDDILKHVHTNHVNVKDSIWLGKRKKREIRNIFKDKHLIWKPELGSEGLKSTRTRPRVSPAEVQFSRHRLKLNVLDALDGNLKTSILTYITGETPGTSEYKTILKNINSRRALHVLVWLATSRNNNVLEAIGAEIIGSDLYYDKTRIQFFRDFVINNVTGRNVHDFTHATDKSLSEIFNRLTGNPSAGSASPSS